MFSLALILQLLEHQKQDEANRDGKLFTSLHLVCPEALLNTGKRPCFPKDNAGNWHQWKVVGAGSWKNTFDVYDIFLMKDFKYCFILNTENSWIWLPWINIDYLLKISDPHFLSWSFLLSFLPPFSLFSLVLTLIFSHSFHFPLIFLNLYLLPSLYISIYESKVSAVLWLYYPSKGLNCVTGQIRIMTQGHFPPYLKINGDRFICLP